ncbi:MAG: hypothetical protein KC442_14190 [Thermomicrobiales bacterium]|nr:hypothetical protein [Thermomicrobiales bacterium]
MSNVSFKRLSVALVGLAVPFSLVGAASAAPSPAEVSDVQLACQAYYDISTCTHAVTDGVYDVVEDEVNAGLGVDYTVEIGEAGLGEPGSLAYDIAGIAVNPLPSLPPMIPVPAVPYQ